MVTCSQRAEPVSASALAMACSMAARVLSRVFGPASLVASSSMAAAPASMRPRRACSSRAALMVEWTQMTRYPSAEGSGAAKVDQTLSRSPIRSPGSRTASVHGGWFVWIQSRNHLSSPRVRGSTVTNRPPAPSMCRIACPEHSFESATYRKSRRPNILTSPSQVGMCVGSSLVLPSASR